MPFLALSSCCFLMGTQGVRARPHNARCPLPSFRRLYVTLFGGCGGLRRHSLNCADAQSHYACALIASPTRLSSFVSRLTSITPSLLGVSNYEKALQVSRRTIAGERDAFRTGGQHNHKTAANHSSMHVADCA